MEVKVIIVLVSVFWKVMLGSPNSTMVSDLYLLMMFIMMVIMITMLLVILVSVFG